LTLLPRGGSIVQIEETKMRGLKIGQLAKLAGCTVKAVRFYEAKGLLPRPARSPSGYRLYTERDLRRLGFIQRAKLIGLPLAKIKELGLHLNEEKCACAALRPHLEQMIQGQLKEVRARLDQLALLREELEGLLAKMDRGKRPIPEELCACAGESRMPPGRLLQIRPKGGSR
jgi:MerR family mercuric resistance operon transcriptional regulator